MGERERESENETGRYWCVKEKERDLIKLWDDSTQNAALKTKEK